VSSFRNRYDDGMAEIVNVRYRTDVLEWVDRVATANGLSRARLIELLTIAAREQGWRPTGTARAASSD